LRSVPHFAKPTPSRGLPLSSLRSVDALGDYDRAMDTAKMLSMGGPFSDPAGEAVRRLQDSMMGIAGIDAAMRAAMSPIVTPVVEPVRGFSMNQLRLPDPPKPEEFYYASRPTVRSVQKGALTCQLWRHQTDDQIFEFKVLFGKKGDTRGAVGMHRARRQSHRAAAGEGDRGAENREHRNVRPGQGHGHRVRLTSPRRGRSDVS
jgi:hypothetical protein